MPKHPRVPESPAFAATMARIRETTGTTTQVQLAAVLEIRQSSISDAKRRQSIPPEWLLTLHLKYAVLPLWLISGEGPRLLLEAAPHKVLEVQERLDAALAEMGRLADLVRETMAVACMTEKDLIKAKRTAQDTLAQALERVDQLTQQVLGLQDGMPGVVRAA